MLGVAQDALSVDFKVPNDSVVSHCQVMAELGIHGKLVRLTKQCINDPKCRVLIQGELFEARGRTLADAVQLSSGRGDKNNNT